MFSFVSERVWLHKGFPSRYLFLSLCVSAPWLLEWVSVFQIPVMFLNSHFQSFYFSKLSSLLSPHTSKIWHVSAQKWWLCATFFVTQHDDHDDYDINVNVMILCGSMSRKQGVMWQLWHLMCETPCKTFRQRILRNWIWKI